MTAVEATVRSMVVLTNVAFISRKDCADEMLDAQPSGLTPCVRHSWNQTREQTPRLAYQTFPSRSHRLCVVNSGAAPDEDSDVQPATTESTARSEASVILLSAVLTFTARLPGDGGTPGL